MASALIRLMGAGLLLLFGALGAAAQENVTVRSWMHPGFGRIVFDWTRPVAHSATLEGRTLSVRFERAMTPPPATALTALGELVGTPELLDEGRTFRVELAHEATLKTFAHEGAVVVDLLVGSTRAPAAAASVAVRIGRHDGYSRIVFDWPNHVGYTLSRDGDDARLRFERGARLDLAEIKADMPGLGAIALDPEIAPLGVALTLAPGTRLRHFRLGPKVVVDLLAADDGSATAPSAAAPSAAAPMRAAPSAAHVAAPPVPAPGKVSIRASRAGPALRLAFGWREPVAAALMRRGGRLWLIFDRSAEPDLAGLAQVQPALAPDLVPSRDATVIRLAAAADLPARLERDDLNWILVLGGGADDGADFEIEARPGRAGQAAVVVRGVDLGARLDVTDPETGTELVVVTASALGAGVPQGRRFVDFALLETLQGIVIQPEVDRLEVEVKRDGVVIGSNRGLRLSIEAALAPKPAPPPPSSPLPAPAPATIHAAAQPAPPAEAEPARNEPTHNEPARTAPTQEEAAAAASAPAAHDAPQGHAAPAAAEGHGEAEAAGGGSSRLLDPGAWVGPKTRSFTAHKQRLQAAMVEAAPAGRNAHRLDLARFLFANGHVPDAFAVIARIEETGEPMAQSDEVRSLRGALSVLMRRPEVAARDLNDARFDDREDIALWRGLLAASEGRSADAQRLFARSGNELDGYPAHLRGAIGIERIEAAIAAQEPGPASAWLDALAHDKDAARERPHAGYLRALLHRDGGEPKEALKLLDGLAQHADRKLRARAAYALALLRLDQGEATRAETIETFERLRFAWRGDAFELNLLRRLAAFYLEEGDFANALRTLKAAATAFSDAPAAREVAEEMARTFNNLFVDGEADKLSPLGALSLFYEFQELTPTGAAGDQMLVRLSERLADVDLLERASELLASQVKHRSGGADKARLGSRLAQIYLQRGEAEAALKTLNDSAAVGAEDGLLRERRHLEARALAALGQGDAALDKLAGDSSAEALIIRADIHWRAGNWQGVVDALANLTFARTRTETLSAPEQATLMRLAVAMALANDRSGLARLKGAHDAAMAAGPYGASFRFITADVDATTTEFRDLAHRIAEIDLVEAFRQGLAQR